MKLQVERVMFTYRFDLLSLTGCFAWRFTWRFGFAVHGVLWAPKSTPGGQTTTSGAKSRRRRQRSSRGRATKVPETGTNFRRRVAALTAPERVVKVIVITTHGSRYRGITPKSVLGAQGPLDWYRLMIRTTVYTWNCTAYKVQRPITSMRHESKNNEITLYMNSTYSFKPTFPHVKTKVWHVPSHASIGSCVSKLELNKKQSHFDYDSKNR